MLITRRGFLGALGIGILGARLAPGRTIAIPKVSTPQQLLLPVLRPGMQHYEIVRAMDAEMVRLMRVPAPWLRFPHA